MPVDLDAPMGDFDAPADHRSEQTSTTLFIESVVKHGFSREGGGDTSGKGVSDESTNDDDSDLVVSDKEDPSDLDEPSLKTAHLHQKKPEQTKPDCDCLVPRRECENEASRNS
ncbi:hypothetical protein BJV82DRAFT_577021 [Fennellomyces sp. T-0311]|nr:hypothetical protein BJV82DRAFT_577021 [Fennellomyces sp. T-0311]